MQMQIVIVTIFSNIVCLVPMFTVETVTIFSSDLYFDRYALIRLLLLGALVHIHNM